MKKFTLNLKKCVFFSALLTFIVFSGFDLPEDDTVVIQNLLNKYHDSEAQGKELKRFELNVTNTGFCRYRKVYNNGKVEYYAFNLSRFKTLDYYGNAERGELYLRTKNDDVIVQVRNDRKGEIDSTTTYMVIPLKNIDVEQLNALAESLRNVNSSTLSANK
ncbi:hypothetical protein [Pedobacter sp. Hv1]|uniref:hypothetical protein n=1 Tax=Pedobacter sp. Hv1 TaxID=1740090 RepID=UPI0006D8C319|nr:hypothetical protein [Pedobacter sp. Hv1]KQC00310.1 hypothetical protein AQF98_12540 [Pedobacter sp. Hv1]